MRFILSILIIPIVYFSLKYFGISINDIIILKIFPFAVSLVITVLILLSWYKKKSLIIYFAKKILKNISPRELEYIHNSTLFWFFASLLNSFIHYLVFINENEFYWLIYSTVLWYGIFIIAGILQYIHRKIYFLKEI